MYVCINILIINCFCSNVGACEASLACSTCHVYVEQKYFDILPEAEDGYVEWSIHPKKCADFNQVVGPYATYTILVMNLTNFLVKGLLN